MVKQIILTEEEYEKLQHRDYLHQKINGEIEDKIRNEAEKLYSHYVSVHKERNDEILDAMEQYKKWYQEERDKVAKLKDAIFDFESLPWYKRIFKRINLFDI